MIPKSALKEMEESLNEDTTAEILIVYNYKGKKWVNPSTTVKVKKGDSITVEFNGIRVDEYNEIETKKWWEFWK